MSIVYSPSSIFMSPPLTNKIPYILSPSSPILSLSDLYSLQMVNMGQSVAIINESVNNNPETKYKMIKYFYYKTLDKWLYGELSTVMNYFTISNGQVQMIKNMSEYKDSNNENDDTIKKKKEYIEKNVFSKHDMTKILIKVIKDNDVMWSDLPRREYLIKEAIKEWFRKKIRNSINDTR